MKRKKNRKIPDIPNRPWDDHDDEPDDDDDDGYNVFLTSPVTVYFLIGKETIHLEGTYLGSYCIQDRGFLMVKGKEKTINHVPVDSISYFNSKARKLHLKQHGDIMFS